MVPFAVMSVRELLVETLAHIPPASALDGLTAAAGRRTRAWRQPFHRRDRGPRELLGRMVLQPVRGDSRADGHERGEWLAGGRAWILARAARAIPEHARTGSVARRRSGWLVSRSLPLSSSRRSRATRSATRSCTSANTTHTTLDRSSSCGRSWDCGRRRPAAGRGQGAFEFTKT